MERSGDIDFYFKIDKSKHAEAVRQPVEKLDFLKSELLVLEN